ncbi:MAG: Lin0512 family protein [Alphaproteobacteria bacterium]|nr:Lin0512 family protein [Alphaproteobacteria bacterium]
MAKKRVALELGMGTALQSQDYTKAAIRAVEDALWHNSLTMADAFGFPKEAMLIDVDVAVQRPDQVDVAKVAAVFPYGQATVRAVHGGLDIPKPLKDGQSAPTQTIVANAAVAVSFDMEPANGAPADKKPAPEGGAS